MKLTPEEEERLKKLITEYNSVSKKGQAAAARESLKDELTRICKRHRCFYFIRQNGDTKRITAITFRKEEE